MHGFLRHGPRQFRTPPFKVAVPMKPWVDGWMGDDWFQNGRCREQNMPYIYAKKPAQENRRER